MKFITLPVIIEYVNDSAFIERKELVAIVDTGATQSCIDVNLAKKLKFTKIGVVKHQTANGIVPVGTHTINLLIPEDIRFDDLEIAECNANVDFVLGLDVLKKCDFLVSHKDGYIYFSLKHPSSNDGLRFIESNNEYQLGEKV